MALLNTLRADTRKMREGVTLRFPEDSSDPIRFQVAHFETGMAEVVQQLPPQERARIENRELTATDQLGLYTRVMGEGVLKGWSNMQEAVLGEDGEPVFDDGVLRTVEVEYSPEKAREILENPEYGELHEAILDAAKNRARYRADLISRTAGN